MKTPLPLEKRARSIIAQFAVEGTVREVQHHVGGHIHDTFLAVVGDRRWLVQRMNTRVFPEPSHVMENIVAVGAHLERLLRHEGRDDIGRRVLRAAPAHDGGWLAGDDQGDIWRLLSYIERTKTTEIAADAAAAESAARAFGAFQRQLAEYAGPPLFTTIPYFHDTPRRFAAFQAAVHKNVVGRNAGAAPEISFAVARKGTASLLADAQARGQLRLTIAHHDAKISNLLFDADTGETLCVVDLDTVMPGLALYDFGDLVRSMASGAAEDDPDPSRSVAEPERLAAIVRGFLEGAGAAVTPAERRLLPAAARVITFEQGMRFLTDHLDGDRYYHIERPGQNLDRCRAQFALLASLERQNNEFIALVASL